MEILLAIGIAFIIFFIVFFKIDTLDNKIDDLEFKMDRVVGELDLITVRFPSASVYAHKTRFGRVESAVNSIIDRINNLPSEKAKVVQKKVEELEQMVKELK